MSWLADILEKLKGEPASCLKDIQDKFSSFLAILNNNNKVLAFISDMEEKSQGDYLFDVNYIRGAVEKIQGGVRTIIEEMVRLGGDKYNTLWDKYFQINKEIEGILSGRQAIERDEYIIPFERLGRDKNFSVGGKNAQLGELMSRLGVPVPKGFAITAWAYKRFIEENNLQERITKLINSVDIKNYKDLEQVSAKIQELVRGAEVPEDLKDAITKQVRNMKKEKRISGFSLRSSAIGEDSLLSFAGQYATYLNVRARDIPDRYRDVLAGKFTPKAIYYLLSHSLSEADLAMSVGCVEMIDASASGVIYTKDPVHPEDDTLIINSIFGLGKYLVDGTLTPDEFRLSRSSFNITSKQIVPKPMRMVMREDGGTVDEPVPSSEQEQASLTDEQIKLLAEYALKIEKHYGAPQDIEWAIDREGRIFFLQTRPLRVVRTRVGTLEPDASAWKVLVKGGVTASPGAGAGPVYFAESLSDLPSVPDGAVLVAPHPFPGIITVMDKIQALVTEVGGVASHMATIAREYRLPTLVGVKPTGRTLFEILQERQAVTVDATAGVIYDGVHEELIQTRKPDCEFFEDSPIYSLLTRVLDKISPLNLINPASPDFTPQNCRTYHDITRFTHQKSMEEMFLGVEGLKHKESLGCKLKSDIPLQVFTIYIDRENPNKKFLEEDEIDSEPMKAFWSGVKKEGWPSTPPANIKGFISVMASTMGQSERPSFSESSFAVLSKEYMVVSLKMGFHFSTIEAMCTDEPTKNYIRMQYKDGGASLERRIRRINLISEILKRIGFENMSHGDFLHSQIAYCSKEVIKDRLYILGRLTIMTKQLDMALSNDSIAQWYLNDFLTKLGLANCRNKI